MDEPDCFPAEQKYAIFEKDKTVWIQISWLL